MTLAILGHDFLNLAATVEPDTRGIPWFAARGEYLASNQVVGGSSPSGRARINGEAKVRERRRRGAD